MLAEHLCGRECRLCVLPPQQRDMHIELAVLRLCRQPGTFKGLPDLLADLRNLLGQLGIRNNSKRRAFIASALALLFLAPKHMQLRHRNHKRPRPNKIIDARLQLAEHLPCPLNMLLSRQLEHEHRDMHALGLLERNLLHSAFRLCIGGKLLLHLGHIGHKLRRVQRHADKMRKLRRLTHNRLALCEKLFNHKRITVALAHIQLVLKLAVVTSVVVTSVVVVVAVMLAHRIIVICTALLLSGGRRGHQIPANRPGHSLVGDIHLLAKPPLHGALGLSGVARRAHIAVDQNHAIGLGYIHSNAVLVSKRSNPRRLRGLEKRRGNRNLEKHGIG
eukprot:comp21646_c0_seq1/m.47896 comp21646_c0_seq1/g.47896  ORF comp21646_c0_seq1/g.47896 comp21646_c0_seq1/m.47896 type:complete len:332 (+) comp21646_c0_seq1:92-1087(+)